MSNPLLTIQLLGWNHAKELPTALNALHTIPSSHAIIRYIDNNSADNSVRIVREQLPQADVVALPENTGYSGGHNAGFTQCTTPYVLVLNPDVAINWNGIQQLITYMEQHPQVGAAQGLLLRDEHIIDSAGIQLTLTLNGKDRGTGKQHTDQFNTETRLTATTGACSLYRLKALKEIADPDIFDETFFAYKEDVDLGWRLNNTGWGVMFVPGIVGTHLRLVKSEGVSGWGLSPARIFTRLRNPRTRYSLRNYVWMILKNASIKQIILHEVFIDLRLLAFFLLSLMYWPLFSVWGEIIRGAGAVTQKRERQSR